jgi:hypothetical protein
MAEEKKELGWPEYLAMGISVLSLFISSLGTFNTVLVQRDDIRFVPGETLDILREKNVFSFPEVQTFAFVNSGNRQAVVSGIYGMLVLAYAPGDPEAQCNRTPSLYKSIYLAPNTLVLKPGEIQVLDAKVREAYPWKRTNGEMKFEETGKKEGAANYVVCIHASITTPDSATVTWIQPLYSLPNDNEAKQTFEDGQPIRVLKRSHLGFS